MKAKIAKSLEEKLKKKRLLNEEEWAYRVIYDVAKGESKQKTKLRANPFCR